MLKRLVTLDYSKSLSRLDLHSLLQYEASAVGKKNEGGCHSRARGIALLPVEICRTTGMDCYVKD